MTENLEVLYNMYRWNILRVHNRMNRTQEKNVNKSFQLLKNGEHMMKMKL